MDDWAVARQPHLLDVFRVTESGHVQTAAWDENIDKPGEWRGWWTLPGPTFVPTQSVCALSPGPDSLQAFVIGSDGGVSVFLWDHQVEGAKWRGPFPIPGIVTRQAVTGVCRAPGLVDIFALGADEQVYTAAWAKGFDAPGKFRGWWRISDFLEDPQPPFSGPLTSVRDGYLSAVSRTPDSLDVFLFRNAAIEHVAWDQHANHAAWTSWAKVCDPEDPPGGSAAGRPSAVALSPDRMDVFSITPIIQGVSHQKVDLGNWKGWFVHEGRWANTQPVKAVRRGAGVIHVFMFGQIDPGMEDAVCHGSSGPSVLLPQPGDVFSWHWEALDGLPDSRTRLAAVSRNPDVVDIFLHGFSDEMFTNSWNSGGGGTWSGWRTIRA